MTSCLLHPHQTAELLIKLDSSSSSADARALAANGHRIRSCSGLAADLPYEVNVWDLSNLRVAGSQLVKRETVVAWLNSIYRTISNSPYEDQVDVCRTATGLHELLAFADAVDTEPGILLACLRHLDHPGLVIQAHMGDQLVQLSTDGRSYFFDSMQLMCATATTVCEVGMPAARLQEQQQLSALVAEQLEALLYQAHAMRLQPLIQRLHCFIASNTDIADGLSVLHGVLGLVFTERVMAAALGPAAAPEPCKAWISSVLTQRCGLVPDTYWSQQLLKPFKLPQRLQDPVRFEAVLQENWQGSKKGDKVAVELDLFECSTIKIGSTSWTVQLVVGSAVTDDATYRNLMSSKLALL